MPDQRAARTDRLRHRQQGRHGRIPALVPALDGRRRDNTPIGQPGRGRGLLLLPLHQVQVKRRLPQGIGLVVQLIVETHRIGRHHRGQLRQCHLGGLQQPAARLQAGILGQQLVGRRHAAGEFGEIDPERPRALTHPVDQLLKRVQRPPVRRPQSDQLASDLRAALPLDIPPGHQPAHRVADKHNPRIRMGRVKATPPLQLWLHQSLQPAPVITVRQAPVIRHRQEIPRRPARPDPHQPEGRLKPAQQPLITHLDRPKTRQHMQVRHHRHRLDPITGMLIPHTLRQPSCCRLPPNVRTARSAAPPTAPTPAPRRGSASTP